MSTTTPTPGRDPDSILDPSYQAILGPLKKLTPEELTALEEKCDRERKEQPPADEHPLYNLDKICPLVRLHEKETTEDWAVARRVWDQLTIKERRLWYLGDWAHIRYLMARFADNPPPPQPNDPS